MEQAPESRFYYHDVDADFVEVLFAVAPGKMVPTDDPDIMRRVGLDGRTLGFMIDHASRHGFMDSEFGPPHQLSSFMPDVPALTRSQYEELSSLRQVLPCL